MMMNADFFMIKMKKYLENLRENAYILIKELQQLQQSKNYANNKSMFMQFYKSMIAVMLTYLKKFLINDNNIKFMIFIFNEIQKRV